MSNKSEASFDRQTSKYRPRVGFRKDTRLVFRRKLANENRAMIWIHKERHAEIDRLAEATGLTMTQVADVLIRYALSQMVVVKDDGTDEDLRSYLNDQIGIQRISNMAAEAMEIAGS